MITPAPTEVHVVLVWERALHVADRILEDAAGRFRINDVVRVTWTPAHFRRNLSRLYGTELPPDSEKERECGTGAFLAIVVGASSRTVGRRARGRWSVANANLLGAKRRYRRWAGGSYRVHTTLTPAEAQKDAVLVLGESLDALRERTWDGTIRLREQDLLGDPGWASLDELETALSATMRCVFRRAPDGEHPFEVLTDDSWWAIRIVDPVAAEGTNPDLRLRRPTVAGSPLAVLIRDTADPDVDPALVSSLPVPEATTLRPTVVDRLATVARLRS